MADCGFEGNTDMYGLGIRIGFYLQWFGTIIANWIARSEVEGLRFSNSLFVFATFLALVIQTIKNTLKPVEIYIILLLTFGGYLWFVPLFLWRGITCSDPRFDPSRFPKVENTRMFSALNFLLLLVVSAFQLWFWFHEVPILSAGEDTCPEYGFLFSKIRLNEVGFVAINALLYLTLLLSCAVILWFSLAKLLGIRPEDEPVKISYVSLR